MLATSYWYFQIMWFNYRACGYNSVEEFVDAMKKPENQFIAFTNFVKSNKTLHSVMKDLNYPKIARYYNWPNYAQNNYDKKLANLEIASTLKTL
jgi:hypothetical protein